MRANRNTNVAWETVPQFVRGVELGGRVWYPVKLLHISYNLFAGTEVLSLSVYEPIAIPILLGGNRPPIWPRGQARGLGVVPRKTPPYLLQFVCWNRNAISPFSSQSQYKFCLGDCPPILGEGVELGGRVWYPIIMGIICLFKPIRYFASFISHTPCKFWGWGTRPPNWGRGGARGRKWSHSKV